MLMAGKPMHSPARRIRIHQLLRISAAPIGMTLCQQSRHSASLVRPCRQCSLAPRRQPRAVM